jgi:hypothetical protein
MFVCMHACMYCDRLTVLRNGRVRISAFLRNDVPFEYTKHGVINPLLRNVQAEWILPRQRTLLAVVFPKQRSCCNGIYNQERRYSVSGPGISALRGGSRQPEPVANSQGVTRSQLELAASLRKEKTSKDRPETRHQWVWTQCKERL